MAIFPLLILIPSLAGVYVCRLIILHLMNNDSPLGKKLCGNSGKFNCDTVLTSDLGKVSKNIHLADVGLIYFISQSLFLILETINGKSSGCIAIITLPCLLAFALTFVSLAYQAFVIKSWCKMCLLVVSIIWLQAIMLVMHFALTAGDQKTGFFTNISFNEFFPSLLTFTVSLLIAGTWLFIKSAVLKASEAKMAKARLLLFKKNPAVFRSLLKTQRTVNSDLWEGDFLLGNIGAPTQLIAALNPYCIPCAREYGELLTLLKMFPNSLSVIIRFLVHTETDHKQTTAVRYLLNEYANTPKDKQPDILERWFRTKSLSNSEDLLSHSNPGQNDLLKKHQQWFGESKIQHTPTLFINGQEMPKFYTASDLKILMPKFLKRPLKNSLTTASSLDKDHIQQAKG